MKANSGARQPKFKGAVPKGAASGNKIKKFAVKNLLKSTKGRQNYGK